jgi:hypothetical protein
MKQEYKDWIAINYGNREQYFRKCAEATLAMVKVFPELSRVRGHIVEWAGGMKPQPHWWCVDKKGEIVDPTALQFWGPMDYLPWREGDREPRGKCPNCGGYVYNSSTCCSDECSEAYGKYVMGEV